MRVILLFCLFLMSVQQIKAQSPEVLVNDIKARYKALLVRMDKYDTVQVDIEESTERGLLTGYYDKDSMRLLVQVNFGEMFKQQKYYCFDKGRVMLVVDVTESYNRPIYYDKKMAKENEDSFFFDPAKSVFTETHYYFSKEKLFHLTVKNGKKEEEAPIAPNTTIALDLVKYAREKMEAMNKLEHRPQKRF